VTSSHPPLSTTARETVLDRLEREPFDCVVIGGGISGAGVARHAAQRGLSVALLEADDFAAGTSSRSSKLIHGGFPSSARRSSASRRTWPSDAGWWCPRVPGRG
jgi:glycine/D-amino acid oxidase-like deaminating enzyme